MHSHCGDEVTLMQDLNLKKVTGNTADADMMQASTLWNAYATVMLQPQSEAIHFNIKKKILNRRK
jgi:hypothetical protein